MSKSIINHNYTYNNWCIPPGVFGLLLLVYIVLYEFISIINFGIYANFWEFFFEKFNIFLSCKIFEHTFATI